MSKIAVFILTNIISTSLVFAEHTKANVRMELTEVISAYSQVKAETTNEQFQCSEKSTQRLIRKIDRRIRKAQRRNESLDKSMKKSLRRFKRATRKHTRMVKRTLKKERRINRAYKKALKLNSNLTKEAFVLEMENSIKPETIASYQQQMVNTLQEAGSLENYLLDLKERVLKCDFSKRDKGQIPWWLEAGVFVALPVLAIAGSIVLSVLALLGVGGSGVLWSIALWLLVGGVGMLLLFVLWTNIFDRDRKKQEKRDDESDQMPSADGQNI